MSSNTLRDQTPTPEINVGRSDSLLAALRAAHEQIEMAFADLVRECAEERFDLSRFGVMRMRVGQALLAKRQVISSVASHLISRVSTDEATAVRELLLRGQRHSQLASEIIRNWTPEMIRQNWNGYCAESRDLRAGFVRLIAAENELFCTLLESRPRGEPA